MKTRSYNIVLALFTIVVGTTACGTNKSAVMSGKWNVESIYGETIAPGTSSTVYVDIDTEQGRIGGYDGCNSIGGTLVKEKHGREISVSDVISTARYCPEMEGRESLGKALGMAASYMVENRNGKQYLVFKDKDGKTCLKLYKTAESRRTE